MKLLEENIGQNHHAVGYDNGFPYMTPKAQKTKEKLDKLDYIKIKIFHTKQLFEYITEITYVWLGLLQIFYSLISIDRFAQNDQNALYVLKHYAENGIFIDISQFL